ncbi:MAG: Ribosomal RNA small subunit methyltransferase H [Phycisphaerae bacterium]|nr:Ribosomal RNA small subunit methyltransferase H [Phycisphaerae bacterium]
MSKQPSEQGPADPQEGTHRRRARYSGTHPRRFDQRYKELNPDAYPEQIEHLRARGRTPAGMHVPIMVEQVLDCLALAPGAVVVDCTLGYGGHAEAMRRAIGDKGRLIALDLDGTQLKRTAERLAGLGLPIETAHTGFGGLARTLERLEAGPADAILADLGVSSMQFDDPQRGFSYSQEGPLDMRMNGGTGPSAADLVNTLPADELAAALEELADEPQAWAIAAAIVARRSAGPIARTDELVEVVLSAQGLTRKNWRGRTGDDLHPAARTFQALRILVNDELSELNRLMLAAPDCLRSGGRIAVIAFHSGEDRLVKGSFRDGLRGGVYDATADGPIRPTPEEVRSNPRSSPAKLRWARKAR